MKKIDPTWFAFLAVAFAVIGLTGMFATFAAPIAYQRAWQREQVLNEAQAALAAPNAADLIAALRPRLDDSAAAVLPVGGDMPARIAAERLAMRARFEIDAKATMTRLRWLVAVVSLGAAGFGAIIMGAAIRSIRKDQESDASTGPKAR